MGLVFGIIILPFFMALCAAIIILSPFFMLARRVKQYDWRQLLYAGLFLAGVFLVYYLFGFFVPHLHWQ